MMPKNADRSYRAAIEPFRALWSDDRGTILMVVSIGWLVSIGVRLVYPALLPSFRADLDLDLTTAGLIVTALWACYALMQFPGGLLADRFGERAVLASSTALTGVGLGVVVFSTGPISFFAGTIVTGFGSGMYATTRSTVLSDIYPERSGTALGFIQAFGNVGTTVLPPIAGFLTVLVSWRLGLGFLLPIAFGAAVALWFVVPVRTSTEQSAVDTLSRETLGTLKDGLSDRSVLLVTVSMLLASVVYQSFTGFYPTYLVLEKGVSSEISGVLYGTFFALGIVLQLLSGPSGDLIGMRWTLSVSLAVSTAGLVLLPFVDRLVGIVLVSVLLSAQLAYWPVVNAYTIEIIPDDMQGTGFGLVRTFYLLVASSGPVIVGRFGDAGMLDTAFFFLAVTGGVSFLLCQFLREP